MMVAAHIIAFLIGYYVIGPLSRRKGVVTAMACTILASVAIVWTTVWLGGT